MSHHVPAGRHLTAAAAPIFVLHLEVGQKFQVLAFQRGRLLEQVLGADDPAARLLLLILVVQNGRALPSPGGGGSAFTNI
jgi:hypothetical protein